MVPLSMGALVFHRLQESLAGQLADGVVGAVVELVVGICMGAVIAYAQAAVDEVQHDAGLGCLTGLGHGGVDGQGSSDDGCGHLSDGVLEGSDVLLGLLLFSGAYAGVVDGDTQFLLQVSLGLQDAYLHLAPESRCGGRGQIDDVIAVGGKGSIHQRQSHHQHQNQTNELFHESFLLHDLVIFAAIHGRRQINRITARPFAE